MWNQFTVDLFSWQVDYTEFLLRLIFAQLFEKFRQINFLKTKIYTVHRFDEKNFDVQEVWREGEF